MRALAIRQPYAELILRGIKTVEYRSRATKIIGERFYIYASRKWAGVNGHSDTLTPALSLLKERELPTGVIVGTAIIIRCVKDDDLGGFEWHLSDVQRIERPRKPKRQPQPVWFRPF